MLNVVINIINNTRLSEKGSSHDPGILRNIQGPVQERLVYNTINRVWCASILDNKFS
ncbi:hypothetical protein OIU79_001292 [Salix purpurea]|uniref:Uncharacterized protein n=1 Tax=Salix purpurea TaxID=77065 RepID=A0A9Q0ZNZ9_SALPP|nr:hypothetical protein OIU79_001292 [Salix purpurea]